MARNNYSIIHALKTLANSFDRCKVKKVFIQRFVNNTTDFIRDKRIEKGKYF